MATQPAFEKPVSVDEYLSMVFEHDCEYMDGVIEERDLGEFEHTYKGFRLRCSTIIAEHQVKWPAIHRCPDRYIDHQLGLVRLSQRTASFSWAKS